VIKQAFEEPSKIMRSSVFQTVFVALVIVAAAVAALKCYRCTEFGDDACSKEKLEGNPAKYSQDCGSIGFDRCMRQKYEQQGVKAVFTLCASQEGCTIAKSYCDQKTPSYEHCEDVVCCDTDNCNAGSAVSFSLFLMAVCYAVGMVLMK